MPPAQVDALIARDPANADWRREHEATRMRVAEAEWRSGHVAAAEAAFTGASASLQALFEKNPTRVTLRRDVASSHLRISRFLLARHRAQPAEVEARACGSTLAPLLASAKPDPEVSALSVHCQAARSGVGCARPPHRGRRRMAAGPRVIESIARTSRDPARLQLWARALGRVGRRVDARSIVEKILATGYRNQLFLDELDDITRGR